MSLLATFTHAWLLASTYGSGIYSCSTYSTGGGCGVATSPTLHIGPITLPVTGASMLGIFGILCIAIAAGVFVWAKQRKKPVASPSDSPPQA